MGADFEQYAHRHYPQAAERPPGSHSNSHRSGIRLQGRHRSDRDARILWHDETMGAKYDVEEIPANLLKKAEAFRMQFVES